MCQCCSPTKLFVFSVFTLIFTAGFLALGLLLPSLLDSALTQGLIDQRLVTSNTSKGYSQWVTSDFENAPPQYFKVFMFNCTNYLDVMYNNAIPIIQTAGPYVYRYHWHKFDIEFSEDGEYVTYFKFENYVYDANASAGWDPYQDTVYVPNLPFLGARSKIAFADQWYESLGFDVLTALGNGSAFTGVKVHDFVWGYNSPFLVWLNQTVGSFQSVDPFFRIEHNCTSEEEARQFLKKPNKYKTGKSNISEIGQYVTFRGQTEQDIWGMDNNNEANQVFGTDGLTFSIKLFHNESLDVFSEDIYRRVQCVTNDTREVLGVPLKMYFLNKTAFSNISLIPEYNLNAPEGVCNLTAVFNKTQGAPLGIISSQPYFFGADPYWQNQVIWDPPLVYDPENHNTFLFVEPYTGITMYALKRLQISVQMSGSLLLYPNMCTTSSAPSPALQDSRIVPVVYFEESGILNDFVADQYKNSVGIVVILQTYGPYALYGISVLFLGTSCFLLGLGISRKGREGYSLIGEETDDWMKDKQDIQ